MGTMKNNKTLTIKTYNMKTKYLIPQTEAIAIHGENGIMLPPSPGSEYNPAPERGGFAPGGGDLGGVPAN